MQAEILSRVAVAGRCRRSESRQGRGAGTDRQSCPAKGRRRSRALSPVSALAERQRCELRLGPGHLGVMANGDLQRSVLERIPRMAREPRLPGASESASGCGLACCSASRFMPSTAIVN